MSEFKDVFTVSNNYIGCTDVMELDVDSGINPVTLPLRRGPMNHKEIVQELLHLVVPIDSPFRASTVLLPLWNYFGLRLRMLL